MNDKDLFHLPRWVITRHIQGKSVLFHADEGEVYALEGSGAQIWEWIAERKEFAFGDLLAAMQERFEAPETQMRGDIAHFLEEVMHEGLLHSGGGEGCR